MRYKIKGYVFENGERFKIPEDENNLFAVSGYDEARQLIEDGEDGFQYYLFILEEIKEV